MRCVIQRVTQANVQVDGRTTGVIQAGLLVLLGVEAGDTPDDLRYCVEKTAGLRIFEDDGGKMNRSLQDAQGAILAVSQFTLLGDARKGRRPSFSDAARPELAQPMFDAYCQNLRALGIPVETGVFQADMQVTLTNDGPVTLLLDSRRRF
jgi:D-tyrosyl-tRNA(Tyr) deacylase